MIDVDQLTQLFAEKLAKTNNHQEAFTKAVWVAYKQGIADASEAQHIVKDTSHEHPV